MPACCREEATRLSRPQEGERLDLPAYVVAEHLDLSKKGEKPMVEKVAGSNLWFWGNVLEESANELHVLFPRAFPSIMVPRTLLSQHFGLFGANIDPSHPLESGAI